MNAIQKSVGEEPVIECQERTFVSCIIPVVAPTHLLSILHSHFIVIYGHLVSVINLTINNHFK